MEVPVLVELDLLPFDFGAAAAPFATALVLGLGAIVKIQKLVSHEED